ncbi:MAG: tail fiber domain-containing protein [Flavobacteriales bacterium]
MHLDNGGTVITGSYRPWMKNGIYMSGNDDMMYVGQLFRTGTDESDAVVAWGDNALSPAGPDNLRFLFMGNGDEGLEVTRVNGSGFFGIGNYNGDPNQPDERLDVRDRTIRLRAVPGAPYEDNTLTKILGVRPDGRVYWRDISTISGDDCDWKIQNTNDVSSVYAGSSCPWGFLNGVGVGIQHPKAKLHVYFDNDPEAGFTGEVTYSVLATDQQSGRAIKGEARTLLSTDFNSGDLRGVFGQVSNAKYSYGVLGDATNAGASPGTSADLIGVSGSSSATNNSVRCVGVYGKASGAIASNSWAGWFDGLTYCTLGVWSASDSQLKRDVQEIENASALLAQLNPRSYEYDSDAFGFMGFDSGRHMGLMADEVAEVLPSAVKDITRPADVDSLGNEVNPAVSFKALNYQELIPLLIASNKEQQDRIDRLESMIAACCAFPSDPDGLGGRDRTVIDELDPAKEQQLRVQPNPFNERTTLYYVLENAGRMQLIANSADGKVLKVLKESMLEAGSYSYEWETAGMAPGIYYITLLVNGEPAVKKAVKVAH